MKTSNILFIVAIITAILSIRFSDSWGRVQMTTDNKPVNTTSNLWSKIYDLKITQKLPKPVKHLKFLGNGNRISLGIEENEDSKLFSQTPQAFTYAIHADTLVIDVLHDYAFIVLKQAIPVEQIALHQVRVDVNGFNQEKLSVDAQKESHFSIASGWGDQEKTQNITYLDIYATERSSVNLGRLKVNTASATIENSVLNYDPNIKVDSLFVTLDGRSTVLSNDRHVVNEVKNIIISGNKQYFKKEFAGKDVRIMAQD